MLDAAPRGSLRERMPAERWPQGLEERRSWVAPGRGKERTASLVAQWLRIRLPMQGTWVRALVQEDPTCRRATKPVRHNY
ncbi:hypothetical protein J1605_012883 [Eschrichtius robustus]|uniref:Uncharacterized protein n=1 Tax=Eschrichtius robustus TaxID=9764 RepID=A0AB34GJ20_ESCRO|nr:hypothetical protein J1605_012883 [Eschrichtius robustus]